MQRCYAATHCAPHHRLDHVHELAPGNSALDTTRFLQICTTSSQDDRLRQALVQDLVLQGGEAGSAADGSTTRTGSRATPLRAQTSGVASVNSAIRDLSKLGF